MLDDIWDRQAEDRACMDGKLREILRNHRHHTGVMGAG